MKRHIVFRQSTGMESLLNSVLESLQESGKNKIEFSIGKYWLSEPVAVEATGVHLSPRILGKKGTQPVDGFITIDSTDRENIIRGLEKIDWTICAMNLLLDTIEHRLKTMRGRLRGFIKRDQANFDAVSRFVRDVLNRFDDPTSYFLALDRFRCGLIANNPLQMFLQLWSSVETISEIYFREDKSTFRKTSSEKKSCIDEYFRDKELSPGAIQECYHKCVYTSIREKIEFTLVRTFGKYSDKLIDIFFNLKDESERLYEIRNDIVHGRKSMYNMEDLIFVERRATDLESIAGDLLQRAIGWKGYGDNLIGFLPHYRRYLRDG